MKPKQIIRALKTRKLDIPAAIQINNFLVQ
jgi:hypothetical protein